MDEDVCDKINLTNKANKRIGSNKDQRGTSAKKSGEEVAGREDQDISSGGWRTWGCGDFFPDVRRFIRSAAQKGKEEYVFTDQEVYRLQKNGIKEPS